MQLERPLGLGNKISLSRIEGRHKSALSTLCVSDLVKRLKGRSSRLLQREYPSLRKRYWGRHFWAIGYGCWSTGNITEEMVNEYLEHHRNDSNLEDDDFILE